MSSTLSMTKCQCNRALSVGGFFHRGVPRSTSGVRLTALHNNTPSLHQPFVSLYLLPCILLFTYFSSWLHVISSLFTDIQKQSKHKLWPHLLDSVMLLFLVVFVYYYPMLFYAALLLLQSLIIHLFTHSHTKLVNLPINPPLVPCRRHMVHLHTTHWTGIIHSLLSHL